MPQIDPSRIKKILVVRPDAIGDLVLTTAAIAALKIKYPQAHIAVLARKYNQIIVKNNPAVDEVISDDIFDCIAKHKKIGITKYRHWIQYLKQKKFDLMINFYSEFPYALIGFLAKITFRIGDKGKILFSWLYNFPVKQNFKNMAVHEVEHQFELLKPLGIEMTGESKLKIYPTAEALAKGKKIISENGLQGKKLIAINLGSGGSDKAWAIKNVQALIKALAKKYETKTILLGGPDEKAFAEKILPEISEFIVDQVGLSFDALFGIISQMHLFIGNNTGPTHIASALQIPTVVTYNSKFQKPGRWAPWANRHKVIKVVSKCPYPCNPPICKRDICTTEISVDDVLLAAEELLAGKGSLSKEEDKLERARLSFNILTFGNDPLKNKILKQLKDKNWRVWDISAEDLKKIGLRDLLDFLFRYDINIIHAMGQSSPKLKIAALLSCLKSPSPIIYLNYKGSDLNHYLDLIK
ncbi:MAG: glycosyltransferase family 9 protein [Candidatus Margulisiibacteriota bacterium]|nr:glycosyltransferase family 9 protein [Candidatus Margulisiibacteriota bacterium]